MAKPTPGAFPREAGAPFNETIYLIQHQSRRGDGSELGRSGDSPLAMRSALTKFSTRASLGKYSLANVVFPEPFGPAMPLDRIRMPALLVEQRR
jgi:hypothetical protein